MWCISKVLVHSALFISIQKPISVQRSVFITSVNLYSSMCSVWLLHHRISCGLLITSMTVDMSLKKCQTDLAMNPEPFYIIFQPWSSLNIYFYQFIARQIHVPSLGFDIKWNFNKLTWSLKWKTKVSIINPFVDVV